MEAGDTGGVVTPVLDLLGAEFDKITVVALGKLPNFISGSDHN